MVSLDKSSPTDMSGTCHNKQISRKLKKSSAGTCPPLLSEKTKQEARLLSQWFGENHRPLPWRISKNPYSIWISEIMLQQTTVKVVIPFFRKFMEAFPGIQDLATAPLEEVYKHWAGLGYYSRARNLHKAAGELSKKSCFPGTYTELLKLPGFGNYTARAVSSQAFGEVVGVVDGNVTRVLCRRFGLKLEFWKSCGQKELQRLANHYARAAGDPGVLNQAFMELGATVCTPVNPTCFLCPLNKNCVAFQNNEIKKLPLKKPKRKMEIWQWNGELYEENGKIAFVRNEYAPFLRGQLILPGRVTKKHKPPSVFHFQHSITHHRIYVRITRKKSRLKKKDFVWITRKSLREKIPFSIIQKAVNPPGSFGQHSQSRDNPTI